MTNEELRNIKLIASDLDGTLLLNGAQELAPGTPELIDAVCDRGIIFAASSGRQYWNLRNLFKNVKHDICYMCIDGGLVMYQDKTIYENVMPKEDAAELTNDILSTKGFEVMISTPKYENLIPKRSDFEDIVNNNVKARTRIITTIYDIDESILKVSLYSPNGLDPERWIKKYGDRYLVQPSGTYWLDITPKGTDKGSGIRKIAEYFNIDPKNIMAFGDSGNDISILNTVGYPVAMEKGIDELKRNACLITPSVESVLKRIIALP